MRHTTPARDGVSAGDRFVAAARVGGGALLVAVGVAGALTAGGCQSYRVEYHERPAYYRNAMEGEPEGQVTLEDGTVLVFTTRGTPGEDHGRADGAGRRLQIREELDDGTIVLRAMLPQHVLANTLTCLRNEEYELMWEQLLADQIKRTYELRGQGSEDFARFLATNRMELAATLTRMMLGLSRGEAFMKNVDGGVIRFYFHAKVASEFRFTTIEVVAEGGGLKLLMIR